MQEACWVRNTAERAIGTKKPRVCRSVCQSPIFCVHMWADSREVGQHPDKASWSRFQGLMMSPGGTAGLAVTLYLLSMPFASDSLPRGLGQEPPPCLHFPYLYRRVSQPALVTFGAGLVFAVGTVLCIVGGLTASLASTQSRQQTPS